MKPGGRSHDNWRARPLYAAVLRSVIFGVPVAVAIGITVAVRSVMPRPRELPESIALWCVLVVLAAAGAIGVERGLRRLVPLTTLLKLSMLFPDRAPSRIAVAREAGSIRRLSARLAELRGDPGAEREASSAATILALATALQAHDRRTRGHAERVRVYTDLLAVELKLPPPDQYRLRWGALLHDIGKLRVSGDILNKPGSLAPDEWKVIRGHPLEGARIAGPLLAWLGPWAGAITDHHERYDGTGYPGGLSGQSISMAGRIVAVADAYDTMTGVRTYRRPMSVGAAREELARCAGAQFDPGVVRAFFAISLPRLLWKTGPLSFVAQLPFLGPLPEAGRQVVTTAGQGITAATVAAGVAIGVLGPVPPAVEAPRTHRAAAVAPAIRGGTPPAVAIQRHSEGKTRAPPLERDHPARRDGQTDGSAPGSSPGGAPAPSPAAGGGGNSGPAIPSPEPSPPPSPSPEGGPVTLPSVPLPPLPPLPLPEVPPPSVGADMGLVG